jgi:hypothetical protein
MCRAEKLEFICSSETSIDFQRTARRYSPQDSALHNHRCENLKSYMHCGCPQPLYPNASIMPSAKGIASFKILSHLKLMKIFPPTLYKFYNWNTVRVVGQKNMTMVPRGHELRINLLAKASNNLSKHGTEVAENTCEWSIDVKVDLQCAQRHYLNEGWIFFFSDCHHIKFQGHTLPEWRCISYISSSDGCHVSNVDIGELKVTK